MNRETLSTMKASPLFIVALFAAGCGPTSAERTTPQSQTPTEAAQKAGAIKTSTDPAVNPNAAVMADFKARVEKYAELHKDLAKGAAKQKEDTSAERIDAQKTALAAKIQAARAGAKQGDIFTPEMRPVFRRLLAPELKGEDGRDAKAIIKDDAPAPGTVPFKVNAKYPEGQPKPTMPANLLLNLPTLPEPLEYRVVGQHLLLLDTAADLIVDYILNVVIT
jgi:hypothetical protein